MSKIVKRAGPIELGALRAEIHDSNEDWTALLALFDRAR